MFGNESSVVNDFKKNAPARCTDALSSRLASRAPVRKHYQSHALRPSSSLSSSSSSGDDIFVVALDGNGRPNGLMHGFSFSATPRGCATLLVSSPLLMHSHSLCSAFVRIVVHSMSVGRVVADGRERLGSVALFSSHLVVRNRFMLLLACCWRLQHQANHSLKITNIVFIRRRFAYTPKHTTRYCRRCEFAAGIIAVGDIGHRSRSPDSSTNNLPTFAKFHLLIVFRMRMVYPNAQQRAAHQRSNAIVEGV
jgi:hypothetical protein